MNDDAERFRRRAKECREVGTRTPHGPWQAQLNDLAHDLEVEADRIDREEGRARD